MFKAELLGRYTSRNSSIATEFPSSMSSRLQYEYAFLEIGLSNPPPFFFPVD
jgi:hypothetical protein